MKVGWSVMASLVVSSIGCGNKPSEVPETEAPKVVAPKAETTNVEAPEKAEAPKADAAAETPPAEALAAAAPQTDQTCNVVSFGRRKVAATKVGSLVEAATKGRWLEPVPATDAEVRAGLFAKFAPGVTPEDKTPLLFDCAWFGPSEDWPETCMLVTAEGGGWWVAREIAFREMGVDCVPSGHPEITGFSARLAKSGEPHAIAPYFWCGEPGGTTFVERRLYETWVDPRSGTVIRMVTRDDGKDLVSTRESIMTAAYWEACNALFKTPEEDVAKIPEVALEGAREKLQRNQEAPW